MKRNIRFILVFLANFIHPLLQAILELFILPIFEPDLQTILNRLLLFFALHLTEND